jgi:hypothetical protein
MAVNTFKNADNSGQQAYDAQHTGKGEAERANRRTDERQYGKERTGKYTGYSQSN